MKTAPSLDVEQIPEELKVRSQWVAWRAEHRDGKLTKVPLDPSIRVPHGWTGVLASSTDPQTWGTFHVAWHRVTDRTDVDGIGFVFSEDDPYVGIDLDHCRDPQTGTVEPWATDIVRELASYTEVSPSGTGLHIIVKGHLPDGARRKGSIEMYDRARYFTMTGQHVASTPPTIEERTAELITLHAHIFGTSPPSSEASPSSHGPRPTAQDHDILARARAAANGAKFERLWRGEYRDYHSQSEADVALASMLAFWTGPDTVALDRLFRQSGLHREKWDERHYGDGRTYGQATIDKALQGTREYYTWPQSQAVASSDPPTPLPENGATWPILDPAAYHGLAGEAVKLIEPHTEADPVALLVSLLAEVGCMLGRGPHLTLDGGYHPLLIWSVMVGQTSKSRKGTAGRRIQTLLSWADPTWTRGECKGNLSSGEGLAFAVRDPQYREEPVKEKGKPTGETMTVLVDSGIEDKRLFLVQSEFGSVLRVMARDGNSLSGVLRDAWDGLDLAPMTKANRVRATAPHIGIVGHVTKDELLRNLTDTETSNGFANRFVWLAVRRSKELPFPSAPDHEAMRTLSTKIGEIIRNSRMTGTIQLGQEAAEAWKAIYHNLSADRPGLAGALLARAEAQVMRLSAIYAVLDARHEIGLPHLKAALALWQFFEQSVVMIFGDSTGDPVADTILRAVRVNSDGKTDTEISNLFGRHMRATRLDQAKGILQSAGLIHCEEVKTEGRSQRLWRAGAKQAKEAKKVGER